MGILPACMYVHHLYAMLVTVPPRMSWGIQWVLSKYPSVSECFVFCFSWPFLKLETGSGCFAPGFQWFLCISSPGNWEFRCKQTALAFLSRAWLSVAHVHMVLYLFPGRLPQRVTKLQGTADLLCSCPAEHSLHLKVNWQLISALWPWVIRLGSPVDLVHSYERITLDSTVSVAQCKSSQIVISIGWGGWGLLRQILLTGNCWKLKIMQNIRPWRIIQGLGNKTTL